MNFLSSNSPSMLRIRTVMVLVVHHKVGGIKGKLRFYRTANAEKRGLSPHSLLCSLRPVPTSTEFLLRSVT